MESSQGRKHLFDLKIPLGSLLGFYGILLLFYGLFGPASVYKKSFNLNVDLIWGILMLVIGSSFLAASYFGRSVKK
ncbi:MAG: hypothetical protein M1469_03960 [Bacteroidetes bacterium]|nr:hypothetical protein [Bacteroidota bacterium]